MPKSPEQWLAESKPPEKAKGMMKLFLGYAPGVGKTFSMLSEAIRRKNSRRGRCDWNCGNARAQGYRGACCAARNRAAEERSITKVRSSRKWTPTQFSRAVPPLCSLTSSPTRTFPGSKHRKRYEDVLELLEAKIDVISTVNIQHIESIAPTVRAITGVAVRETVPDWVLQVSEETVMVDLTPEALQNRMKRGDVYNKDKVEQALKNFFRRGNLIALRELALRQVAEQVDRSLESYMVEKDIQESWAVRERIAVLISANPKAQYLVARAARMARRMDGDLYAVHIDVNQVDSSEQDQKLLTANMQFAESLGAKTVRLKGDNVADATAQFVREKHITQVIFGRTAVEGWRKLLFLNTINRFLRDVTAVDVHIVTQEPD